MGVACACSCAVTHGRRARKSRPIKALAARVNFPYKLVLAAANQVVKKAASTWTAAIDASNVSADQKIRLKALLVGHPCRASRTEAFRLTPQAARRLARS